MLGFYQNKFACFEVEVFIYKSINFLQDSPDFEGCATSKFGIRVLEFTLY
jgi:hypothetical protein